VVRSRIAPERAAIQLPSSAALRETEHSSDARFATRLQASRPAGPARSCFVQSSSDRGVDEHFCIGVAKRERLNGSRAGSVATVSRAAGRTSLSEACLIVHASATIRAP